ncbi:MAG: 5-formyltetrahydrofolate cyclo-ligase [Sedimentisphaerales bacterium]|nr:5-formyltetrahydrofolate cyclo-ligase [Sedimentisphaerales bacterium]
MDKAQLRLKLKNCLLNMDEKQRAEKSRQACKNLAELPQFQEAETIMMYLSLPYEIDTSEAILQCWKSGKTVAVPKISWEQRHMIPVQINSLETGFSTGALGLRNPISGVPVPFEDIDLVVTPALGYDKKGNRLGRGGSYYDRFFANEKLRAYKCGFAFAEQIIDSIPVNENDKPVDSLVTDNGVMFFNHKKGV